LTEKFPGCMRQLPNSIKYPVVSPHITHFAKKNFTICQKSS